MGLKKITVRLDEDIIELIKERAHADRRSLQVYLDLFFEKHLKPKKIKQSKPKPETNIFEYLNGAVSLKAQELWIKTYQDREWIQGELHKADAWYETNAHKSPKKEFGRFYNNWLSRGWENHRKGLKSLPSHTPDYHIEQMKRLERGEM